MTDHLAERPGPHVSVTWYGQAGFRLAAGDSRVLIDPFLTDRADRRYPPPAVAADFPDITLVLCTHEHVDHMDLPFLRKFCAVNPSARIVLPAPVIGVAVSGGPAAVSALAPDVLMIPINGRDHMREANGIVGNMNETEAAWLCSQVDPAYVIPMHYDAIASNTGDPGHFTSLVRESGASTTVLVPPRASTFTLALP